MRYLSILFLSLAAFSSCTFAKEPVNLAVVKANLVRYHDSGEYDHDVASVIHNAKVYLEKRITASDIKKPAIILDIDETSLSNYPALVKLNFGGSLQEIDRLEKQGNDPVIAPTLKLFQYAKAHHVAVFFVTGRTEAERAPTIKNLNRVGYQGWDGIFFKPNDYKAPSVVPYKTSIRHQIAKQGYQIIESIGDQFSDLSGKHAEKVFKLPNPFYYIG